jgi:murein DD-endopeptidase MepM/ murein hydrolase activator NlpD
MRIRSVKPEFWRSDDVAVLSREHRLLFIGLWSYVDDNGVGIDDYRQVAADLFALDDDQNEVREFVREGLARLAGAFLIARYEVGGRRYLYVTGWKHQRVDKPNKPRYPLPPRAESDPPTCDDGEPSDSIAGDSGETRESPVPVTEEQRNRGTEEQRRAPARSGAEPAGFPEFYEAYPRKRERKKAATAYRTALRNGAKPERLIQAAQAYAHQVRGKDLQYVKYPASWLNAAAYDDEPERPALRAVSGGHQPWQNPIDQSEYDEPMFPTEELR